MKLKWLKFFESQQKDEEDGETENLLLKEKVSLFLRTFRQQSLQYQIVWTVRILCWILLAAVALFGTVIRIHIFFKKP